jgi:streptomycin 6-kinase
MDKPIAHGRRSDLYAIKNTVLKLYDENFPINKIHKEFIKAKSVWKSSKLNVPKPIKEVTKGNRHGILFEKTDGTSLMNLFQRKPWLYFTYTKKIVEVHKEIHRNKAIKLPTQQDEFTGLIEKSDRLSTEDKKRLIEILNLKYEPVLCHGDFHHGNLIQTPKVDVYIVDWMDAFIGSYKLDVALTATNAMISDSPKHVPKFYRSTYEFLKKLVKLDERYIRLYGLTNCEEYIYLAAGIHLARGDKTNLNQHLKYFKNASLY